MSSIEMRRSDGIQYMSCYLLHSIPVQNYKTVHTSQHQLGRKIHVMNLALRWVPIEGQPLGREDMTRGGAGAFFTARGHCCSDTLQTKTNIEKQLCLQINAEK